jgi:hypothetical protein
VVYCTYELLYIVCMRVPRTNIRDEEVNAMITRLAELRHLTKTEVIRRAIQRELDEEMKGQRQEAFGMFLDRFISKQKKKKLPPHTKEESDELFADMGL